MALESKSNPVAEEEQQQEAEEVNHEDEALARNPYAPPDNELFDITTTVDPSYIISLIRKLIPVENHDSHGVKDGDESRNNGGLDANQTVEESGNNECESMDVVDRGDNLSISDSRGGGDKDGSMAGEEVWEEYGCVLWDLAASRTHAELMVQNLVLEVLMANLMVSQSSRVTEICIGIIGNLACHETTMKHIVSTNGLIAIIVDQLFLDDIQCLSEVCRLLNLGLQGSECGPWTEAVQSDNVLRRVIWIAENTLNAQLLEKSVGLILRILESQQEASRALIPSLMTLGLPNLLISLLDFEIIRLTDERVPERYPVLDVILRAIEALSILDGLSQEICSNKKLFQLVCDLVKFPDKAEVSSSCVTVAVLIANILSDVPDLASEMSQDLPFLQGLLEIFPLASDDVEARKALWIIIARVLVRVRENEMTVSSLHQYALVLASKSDIIEDDLLDQQFDKSFEEIQDSTNSGPKSNPRNTALTRIVSFLSKWNASKECLNGGELAGDGLNIQRLLDCCCKHIEFTERS